MLEDLKLFIKNNAKNGTLKTSRVDNRFNYYTKDCEYCYTFIDGQTPMLIKRGKMSRVINEGTLLSYGERDFIIQEFH